MTHWKLTLSYNGSSFHGWQVQPGLVTVQGTLAQALHEITGAQVLPQGAGRTDAGVHALAQVASFALPTPIPPANLQRALNRVLPPGLRVLEAQIVPPSFHARHSARRKVYEYRLFERRTLTDPTQPAQTTQTTQTTEERICSPFLAPFVWDCRWPLNFDLLQQSAALLTGTHDFSSMAATGRPPRNEGAQDTDNGRKPTRPNPVKTIYSSQWSRAEGLLVYRVCGNGFLHHMVRNLVGTMVDIGRGSLLVEDLPHILASRDRSQAGPTAPASGLYLVEVIYDDPQNKSASTENAREESYEPANVHESANKVHEMSGHGFRASPERSRTGAENAANQCGFSRRGKLGHVPGTPSISPSAAEVSFDRSAKPPALSAQPAAAAQTLASAGAAS